MIVSRGYVERELGSHIKYNFITLTSRDSFRRRQSANDRLLSDSDALASVVVRLVENLPGAIPVIVKQIPEKKTRKQIAPSIEEY